MRKVVAWESTSVDCAMESPEEWAFSYPNDEIEDANAGDDASDVFLLGRATYEELAAY